jgi:1-acyl-sn-glycerol-3-phosphate acyltransferase
MTEDLNQKNLLKNRFTLKFSRFIFRLFLPLFGGLKVEGSDNVPKFGAALLCPNHTTDLDPVVICAATDRLDLNALAKSELFEIPVIGGYFNAIGAIPVVRDSADRKALRVAESILKAGRILLVFPEGRCSKSGLLMDIQSGALLLSQKTDAPIIPVGIRGSRNVLPYGKYIPRFATGGVTIVFGKPINPTQYATLHRKAALAQMTTDLRNELARLTGQS